MTLAEEAADVRGSTPTDCARRLVPDRKDITYELASLVGTIESGVLQTLERAHGIVDRALLAPGLWISGRRADLTASSERCVTGARQWLRALADRLDAQHRLFASFDPKGVLARGYAILRDANGRGLTSISRLKLGQEVTAVLKDGEAGMCVSKFGSQTIQPKLL
jgi:exodeoxyribonuclease VII large subunit